MAEITSPLALTILPTTAVRGPQRLDSLAHEIILRILAVGCCENALALAKVNQRLRRICKDPVVFNAIVENGNGYFPAASTSTRAAWWLRAGLSPSTKVSTCAKWALADSKAVQFIHNPDREGRFDRNMIRWLPHLLIHNHPIGQNFEALDTLSLVDLNKVYSVAQLGSFCYAWRALEEFRESQLRGNDVERETQAVLPGYLFSAEVLSQALTPAPVNSNYPGEEDSVWKMHFRANFGVGAFSQQLRNIDQIRRLRQYTTTPGTPNISPPYVQDIPLSAHMQVERPFSRRRTVQQLGLGHLEKMANSSFLEDGPWTGYYCYSFEVEDPLFDPMMQDVQFRTEWLEENCLTLSGSGMDSHGTFGLSGALRALDGAIRLVKDYANGTRWEWDAVMTPFGIVGTWGDSNWGGWLWLWKESWSKHTI